MQKQQMPETKDQNLWVFTERQSKAIRIICLLAALIFIANLIVLGVLLDY
jgi:hypothetical protein